MSDNGGWCFVCLADSCCDLLGLPGLRSVIWHGWLLDALCLQEAATVIVLAWQGAGCDFCGPTRTGACRPSCLAGLILRLLLLLLERNSQQGVGPNIWLAWQGLGGGSFVTCRQGGACWNLQAMRVRDQRLPVMASICAKQVFELVALHITC